MAVFWSCDVADDLEPGGHGCRRADAMDSSLLGRRQNVGAASPSAEEGFLGAAF